MKKHIVILSAFLSPYRSGAEACVEEVPPLLSDRFAFSIITARLHRSLPTQDVLHGIPVVRVGLGFRFDKWFFPFLAPFTAKRLHPDLIHAVLESYAGLALIFCRVLCPLSKTLLTCQSTNTIFLLRQMHRSAHAITAISRALVERAKHFGRHDVALIPNGVAVGLIRASCEHHEKISGRILFVGRLESMKGIDTLLDAFERLLSRGVVPDANLHIVGEGSERTKLERRARMLHIAERVRWTGWLLPPALYDEFAQAQIFCGLSRSEALGNVFLEAQAAGCAVVATHVGGIPDVVLDGETGTLVAPNDPHAASQAIETLLTDVAYRERFADAGRRNADAYDWPAIAEKYGHIYDRLAT